MAEDPIHVDLSSEIENWKNAVQGKDVRGSSISAFQKLQEQTNICVDYIVEKGETVDQAARDVQIVRQEAQGAVTQANNISTQNKQYVDTAVAEYKRYADTKLEETEDQKRLSEVSAAAAQTSATSAANSKAEATQQAAQALQSAKEAKGYADQCAGAAGFDGMASSVKATDTHSLGSSNVQGQLDALADGMKNIDMTASSVTAVDAQGLVVVAGKDTNAQALFNALAVKVAQELVSNTALVTKLAGYVAKTDIVQTESTATNTVPSSAYFKQVIDTQNSNLENLSTTEWTNIYDGLPGAMPDINISKYKDIRISLYSNDLYVGGWYTFSVSLSNRIQVSYLQNANVRVLMSWHITESILKFGSQEYGAWATNTFKVCIQAK